MGTTELWIIFFALFFGLLAYDLYSTSHRSGGVGIRKAGRNVAIFVAVALAFGALILYVMGTDSAVAYYAAYTIEFAMSVDNLFVFIIIFSAFSITGSDQHRVLFYGILGAIFFRALFVFIGAELLETFDWMMLVFGAILAYVAVKTILPDRDKPVEKTLSYRIGNRIRSADVPAEGKFIVKVDGKYVATVLLVCLLVIELSDILFAFDSIPAALSITTDVFLVFTSNIFAVLGLRSLYFVLNDILSSLKYLNYGLGIVLGFIAVKMFGSYFGYEVPVLISLIIIIAVLVITVVASKFASKKDAAGEA